MNEKDIRKYASLMKELELTGLEITVDENKVVRLERAGAVAPVAQAAVAVPTSAVPVAENNENADYISVKSPIVGVFYAAPAENAEPFVSLGQKVEKGAVIKNSIVMSDVTIKEGAVVEYSIIDERTVIGKNAVVGQPKDSGNGIALIGRDVNVFDKAVVKGGEIIDKDVKGDN